MEVPAGLLVTYKYMCGGNDVMSHRFRKQFDEMWPKLSPLLMHSGRHDDSGSKIMTHLMSVILTQYQSAPKTRKGKMKKCNESARQKMSTKVAEPKNAKKEEYVF